MKTLSVQQPWASLICSGIKDIENRTWKPSQVPGRILIHASSKKVPRNFDSDYLKETEVSTIRNLKKYGIIPEYKDMPVSSIIGYVDVTGFTENATSFWAIYNNIHWQLQNAWLFDDPILNVKGKLNIFDYPLDENNLPAAHQVKAVFPVYDSEILTLQVSADEWENLKEGGVFVLDICDPYTLPAICANDNLDLKPVRKIDFSFCDQTESYEVSDIDWDVYRTERGEPIVFRQNGDKTPWCYAAYYLGKRI